MNTLNLIDIETDVVNAIIAIKSKHFVRVVEGEVGEYANHTKWDTATLSHTDATHCCRMSASTITMHPLSVMDKLRTIDAYA